MVMKYQYHRVLIYRRSWSESLGNKLYHLFHNLLQLSFGEYEWKSGAEWSKRNDCRYMSRSLIRSPLLRIFELPFGSQFCIS